MMTKIDHRRSAPGIEESERNFEGDDHLREWAWDSRQPPKLRQIVNAQFWRAGDDAETRWDAALAE